VSRVKRGWLAALCSAAGLLPALSWRCIAGGAHSMISDP
jgi:hypothetical protein